jgi:ubiquinone/menaquinone biosynthesis C-methylase UbiE
MAEKFDIQVPKEVYFEKYDNVARFVSYFYQIDLVKRLTPNNVLEIGVGNKTVSNYLRQSGIKIDTCDFDEELEPDHVADIRNLPFKDNTYDVVIAYEIIEHIPWVDVAKALQELRRVSKRYVLISIPHPSIEFELIFKFPHIGRILRRPFLHLFFGIPYFFAETRKTSNHYWEMGRKNYPAKKMRSAFGGYFKILKEVRPILNPCHHFFVLEKKVK